jgi:gliding motility-associated-like protein
MYNLLQLKKVFISVAFIVIAFSAFSQSTDWYWGKQGSPFEKSEGWGASVATDKWGNAYHIGAFDLGVSFGSFNLMSTSADQVVFLVKYNSAGTVKWAVQATNLGYTESLGESVTTDDSGFVYITGYFWDTVQFGNTPILTAARYDVFLVKYDTNGNVIWAIQSHSNSNRGFAISYGVSADKHGGIYVTGYFKDTVAMGTDTLRSVSSSGYDVFIMKYNKFGNFLWARQSDSAAIAHHAISYCIAADSAGNAYIAGTFRSGISFGNIQLTSSAAGYGNMFVAKYSPAGNVLWANQSYSTSSSAVSYGIAVDSFGGVYTSGQFYDTVTIGATTLVCNPSSTSNIFLAKYLSNGDFDWVKQSKHFDSVSWAGYGVSTDHKGHEYIVGGTILNSTPAPNAKLWFENDTVQITLDPGTTANPSVFFQLDTTGKVLCKTIMADGGYWDAVASDAAGKYVYMAGTGNESGSAQSIAFGTDSVSGGSSGGVYPYVARWQTCCGVINSNVSAIDDTCNKPNGIAFATANGTNGPFSYTWSPAGGSDSVAQSLTAGTYNVRITDAKSCFITDTITIANYNIPISVNVCCDTTLTIGDSVTLNASGANKYSWTPNINLSCDSCASTIASPTITTQYYVTASNKQGCRALDSVLITVDSAEKPCGNVFVPNAFSPNGDNVNDILYVYGDCIQYLDFKIFDRWGNKVFETTDQSIGWDGRYKGQPANSDVYDYTLIATQSNGKTTSQKGNITLVR